MHYPDDARNSYCYAFVVAAHLPASVKTHLFGRAYVMASSDLGQTHNPLIFAGEPGWPISKFMEIGMYKGTWQPSYQENKSARGQGRGEATYHAESGPPVGKWFLLEWEFNDNPASITYWVDGEKILTPAGLEKEKKETINLTWPAGSNITSGLVGADGFQEVGVGARGVGVCRPRASSCTTTTSPSAPRVLVPRSNQRAKSCRGRGVESPERIIGAHSRKPESPADFSSCNCASRSASARPFPALSSR